MQTLELITISSRDGLAQFGELYSERELIAFTIERPWLNNSRNISCIPAGDYLLQPHESPKFGKCLALVNANVGVTIYGPSQRTHCLIHPANRVEQLHGCIAPGLTRHPDYVGESRLAMSRLLELVGDKPAQLIINRD